MTDRTASGLTRRTTADRQRRLDAQVATILAEVAHEWRMAPDHPPSPGTMRPLPLPRRHRWWPGA